MVASHGAPSRRAASIVARAESDFAFEPNEKFVASSALGRSAWIVRSIGKQAIEARESTREPGTILPQLVVALFLILFVAATARAVAPNFTAITAAGGQRGSEVEVTLRGERLADAQEIFFYNRG